MKLALVKNVKERTYNNMNNQDIPYIDNNGTIIVPFNADKKYHPWSGGQPLSVTLLEINAPKDIWSKYTEKPYPGNPS